MAITRPPDAERGPEEVGDQLAQAYVYLSAVSERPTATLWDLVDERGAVQAARDVRTGRVPDGVRAQTGARSGSVDPAELLGRADEAGAHFLHPAHPHWPSSAFEPLDTPRRLARSRGGTPPASVALRPFGLWWRGPAEPLRVSARATAVVGTRAPSSYGRAVAAEIAATCATADMAIVSGGAFGIDAAAHRAAVSIGGTTVAVLAGGIDHVYPRGNAGLLEEVARTGALVATQPPGAGVTRFRFLDRNRIIAALSGATVVVEAAARSGALSTAAWASGLGRPVGAVPGPITAVSSLGCHVLIRDRGAVLISRSEEVIELAGRVGELAPEIPTRTTEWDGLDDRTRRVLENVPLNRGAGIAEVSVSAGISPSETRAVMGALLADGRVGRHEGGWRRLAARGDQMVMPM